MTPAIALLVIGGILLKAGWKNQSILDVALGRDTQRSGGGVPGGSDGSVSSDAFPPPAPGIGSGTTTFEGTKVASWIAPILRYARQHGWKGTVTSGYRSLSEQTYLYNRGGSGPVAKPGTSNHEQSAYPGGAVDVSSSSAAQLSNILRHSPYANALQWAGSKDPVHFSHPHGGGY